MIALRLALSPVSLGVGRCGDCPTGDRHPMASSRASSCIGAGKSRSRRGRPRIPWRTPSRCIRIEPAQSALGCASHPRRSDQTRDRCRAVERRRLISLSVTDHPTAEWVARQITEASLWDEAPAHHLIRYRDARHGDIVRRRMAAMGIRDHPTAPRSTWQSGHAERLIGSIRRVGPGSRSDPGQGPLASRFAAHAAYSTSGRICP